MNWKTKEKLTKAMTKIYGQDFIDMRIEEDEEYFYIATSLVTEQMLLETRIETGFIMAEDFLDENMTAPPKVPLKLQVVPNDENSMQINVYYGAKWVEMDDAFTQPWSDKLADMVKGMKGGLKQWP